MTNDKWKVITEAQQPTIMYKGESAAAQLRAMATNYPAGHLWDKLDAKACIRGALEIESLKSERDRFRAAYHEWSDKTEWARKDTTVNELGKHLADVLRERIEELQAALKAARLATQALNAWQPIETAPKSPANGDSVDGIYLLGFCQEPDTCNLRSYICIGRWEPLMRGGKGMWYSEGGHEVHPTHWMPLHPAPSTDGESNG